MAEHIKMATQSEKRTRTKNFSEKEKEMLIDLINPHKNIIENIIRYVFYIIFSWCNMTLYYTLHLFILD